MFVVLFLTTLSVVLAKLGESLLFNFIFYWKCGVYAAKAQFQVPTEEKDQIMKELELLGKL